MQKAIGLAGGEREGGVDLQTHKGHMEESEGNVFTRTSDSILVFADERSWTSSSP